MQYSIHTSGTTGLYTRDYSEQLWFPLNEIHQPQLLRVNQGKPQLQIKQLMYTLSTCTPPPPHTHKHTQVSCIASSPAFRNRNIFPRYFQLLPTEASLATAYYAIIKHYNWRRVALIVQDENIFTVVGVAIHYSNDNYSNCE